VSDDALVLEGIEKAYGSCVSNAGCGLRVRRGSIHALVGENGAGKTTLLSIAYGEVRADAGRIVVAGQEVDPATWSPARAIAAGLGMVHQHFMLVPTLTVAENVMLGREPRTPAHLLDVPRVVAELRTLGDELGLTVWPEGETGTLSVGEQQRVEIVKVLWRGAQVLLLDEPTAVLSPPEVKELLRVLVALRDAGKTVVLCTHRLDEVAQVADRVTVLRKGKVVRELERGEASSAAIARAMLGEDPTPPPPYAPAALGDVTLEVAGLKVARPGAADAVAGVSFAIRAGEILGIAGVEGNGQSELVEVLAGTRRATGGRVLLGDQDVTAADARGEREAGVGHIPEDRRGVGLVLHFSVAENLFFGRERSPAFAWREIVLRLRAIVQWANRLVKEFDIRTPSIETHASALSGGNQQKIIVAREMGSRPKVLLAAQPTRGVDVGSIEFIHRRLVAERDEGTAVLLVSAELEEVTSLSDRIAVMYEGRIVSIEPPGTSEERLGLLMTGGGTGAGAA